MEKDPISEPSSPLHEWLQVVVVIAVPVVLFLLIYSWWDPSLTRSDRQFRKEVGNVVEVQMFWQTWSRNPGVKTVKDITNLTMTDKKLLTLKGKALRDFLGNIRVKDVNASPGWGKSKNCLSRTFEAPDPNGCPGMREGFVIEPHMYLQFTTSNQRQFQLDVFHGWFVVTPTGLAPGTFFPGVGRGTIIDPGPWNFYGVPLQNSTIAYLKGFLKPHNIPDESLDGERLSATQN